VSAALLLAAAGLAWFVRAEAGHPPAQAMRAHHLEESRLNR
jgi:MFS transporter, DHA2 family, methylenomycin A resistance protein